MTFQWSENAAHIQGLYRPWYPSDGYAEHEVRAAEAQLGLQFPAVLRRFYLAWGARDDLARANQILLAPHDVFVQSDALIICAENQWVSYWGVPLRALDQDNPPVWTALNEDAALVWQQSHAQLSDFLDFLTYMHAFGAALHGGYSNEQVDEELWERMRQYGRELVLPTYPPWFVLDENSKLWLLIIGQHYVMDGLRKVGVATSTRDILDQISDALHITWERRW